MAHTTQIHTFFNSKINYVKKFLNKSDQDVQLFVKKFLPHDKPLSSIINSILVSLYQLFLGLPSRKFCEIAFIAARFLEFIVIAGDKGFDAAKNYFTPTQVNLAF
jgi:hypothetical protein